MYFRMRLGPYGCRNKCFFWHLLEKRRGCSALYLKKIDSILRRCLSGLFLSTPLCWLKVTLDSRKMIIKIETKRSVRYGAEFRKTVLV